MSIKRVSNPPNPWLTTRQDWLGEPPAAAPEVYLESARSILSENESPDLGFRWSLNPYRGCHHACAYCYARPTHQYLEFGAGTDFETKLVVKTNAAELLRMAFEKKSWQGETIVFSGVTDCYQPLEATYKLTRECLEVCLEYRNPVSIITKSPLICRDVELLKRLAERTQLHVSISLAFTDERMARKIEPTAPLPSARFKALQELSRNGISTGVAIAPVIPGLNDYQVAEVLRQASEHGAKMAFSSPLRLSAEVQPVFLDRLKNAYSERYDKVVNGLKELREGKLNNSNFGERMTGKGQRWSTTSKLFSIACSRLGLTKMEERFVGQERQLLGDRRSTFRRPNETTLFDMDHA